MENVYHISVPDIANAPTKTIAVQGTSRERAIAATIDSVQHNANGLIHANTILQSQHPAKDDNEG